jgi:5-methylcytosine-specific restriction endonuclease McrA
MLYSISVPKISRYTMASQLTPKKYTTAERLKVWKHHISREAALCPMCLIFGHARQFVITQGRYSLHHVVPKAQAYNEHLSNLRPVCVHCNSQMGSKKVYDTSLFVYLYPDDAANITRAHSCESDEDMDPEITEEEYDAQEQYEAENSCERDRPYRKTAGDSDSESDFVASDEEPEEESESESDDPAVDEIAAKTWQMILRSHAKSKVAVHH